MIILKLYDIITGYDVQNEKYMIDFASILNNIIGLIQNLIAAYIYFVAPTVSNMKCFAEIVYRIAIVDWIFIQDNTFYFHHFLIIVMYYCYKCNRVNMEDNKELWKTLLGTELSTIFLSARRILLISNNTPNLLLLVNVLFAIVFFYMRLIKGGYYTFFKMERKSVLMYGAMIAFFALNCYWGVKIAKLGYREFLSVKS
jgi:hypothetical protein